MSTVPTLMNSGTVVYRVLWCSRAVCVWARMKCCECERSPTFILASCAGEMSALMPLHEAERLSLTERLLFSAFCLEISERFK